MDKGKIKQSYFDKNMVLSPGYGDKTIFFSFQEIDFFNTLWYNKYSDKLTVWKIEQYGFPLLIRGAYYEIHNVKIWQYSSSGRIPGIEGNVDLNICFKPYGESFGRN